MPKNNLVFISGPPGAGKTSLLEHLCREDARISAHRTHFSSFDFTSLDPENRNFSEIWRQATQNLEYLSSAAERLEYIFLGEKCIYDLKANNEISFKTGKLSLADYESSFSHISDFFSGDLSAPYAIVLNPGYDVCKNNLEETESNLSYLALACNEYKALSGLENVLYLDSGQDLSENGRSGIISWVYDKYNHGVSKEKAVRPSANDIYDYVINGVVHRNDRGWLDALSSAPRILDQLLESETRNRILHSFHCTGSVDPNDREHAIQLVQNFWGDYYYQGSFRTPYSPRVDATDIVDRAFGYYAGLAKSKRYDSYAKVISAQDEESKK